MTIKFDLPATGSAEHVITHAPTAGFHEWQRLDMKRMFNSDQVELSKLTEFRLISDVGNYIPWESDYWKVESKSHQGVPKNNHGPASIVGSLAAE